MAQPETIAEKKILEYCDLVMKGGITSGIVYPNAVIRLAQRFTFKNIGGTSAGAIAAAATAAAALGQRSKDLDPDPNPAMAGFDGLQQVAAQLRAKGFIYSLFQPAKGGRRIFAFVVRATACKGMVRKLWHFLVAVLLIAPIIFSLSLSLLLGFAWWMAGAWGIAGAFLPALACAFAAAAIRAAFASGRIIRQNRFGLCPGLTTRKGPRRLIQRGAPPQGSGRKGKLLFLRREAPPKALTEWLHDVIQSLAGLPADRPLLFEDLWQARRYDDEVDTMQTISLEMITTDVSHREPRSLPISSSTFWFREDEFATLFPKDVVDWLVAQDPDGTTSIAGDRYHQLPTGGRMPVLVATRMSLSFPLLLSAVPLHEPDFANKATFAEEKPTFEEESESAESAEEAAAEDASKVVRKDALEAVEELSAGGGKKGDKPKVLRPCWFSDGGISSNFPLHLFDAPLPRWPTFAINLLYPQPGDDPKEVVHLPKKNNSGWQRRYEQIDGSTGLAEVSAFLFAIVGTMQNWRDLLQSRAPGHRDRIVHVALSADEGGINLDMPQTVLDEIASKGTSAGEKLAGEFKFDNHYWVRWRNVAGALERFMIGFAKGAESPITRSYQAAYNSATTGKPAPPSYKFLKGQKPIALARFAQLETMGRNWAGTKPPLSQEGPNPQPELRVVPIF